MVAYSTEKDALAPRKLAGCFGLIAIATKAVIALAAAT